MALLYTDLRFLEHQTGEHPECPERLRFLNAQLDKTGLAAKFERPAVVAATREQIARIHKPAYIAEVERFATAGGGRIETDTTMSCRSYEAATLAAGAAVSAVDRVLDGPVRRATCLVRPPGHHALAAGAMGFCLFNNVAVAAAHALSRGLERVLIVDWDVHHGNGTQDVFYDDGHVYFLSVHRYPFYPGTGAAEETGTGAGAGTIFNLPIRFGVKRSDYLQRFETILTEAAKRAKPELVLLSAGFDAHAADPIGSLGLETEDFAPLTTLVLDAAEHYCGGKFVSLLEGGYNVPILADCVALHLETVLAREKQG